MVFPVGVDHIALFMFRNMFLSLFYRVGNTKRVGSGSGQNCDDGKPPLFFSMNFVRFQRMVTFESLT